MLGRGEGRYRRGGRGEDEGRCQTRRMVLSSVVCKPTFGREMDSESNGEQGDGKYQQVGFASGCGRKFLGHIPGD